MRKRSISAPDLPDLAIMSPLLPHLETPNHRSSNPFATYSQLRNIANPNVPVFQAPYNPALDNLLLSSNAFTPTFIGSQPQPAFPEEEDLSSIDFGEVAPELMDVLQSLPDNFEDEVQRMSLRLSNSLNLGHGFAGMSAYPQQPPAGHDVANTRMSTRMSYAPSAPSNTYNNNVANTFHPPANVVNPLLNTNAPNLFKKEPAAAFAPNETSSRDNKDYDSSEDESYSESRAGKGNDQPTEGMSRRQMHVISEQKRRKNMKEAFSELATNVPGCKDKTSKLETLHKAVEYIQYLRKNLNKLHLENMELKQNYLTAVGFRRSINKSPLNPPGHGHEEGSSAATHQTSQQNQQSQQSQQSQQGKKESEGNKEPQEQTQPVGVLADTAELQQIIAQVQAGVNPASLPHHQQLQLQQLLFLNRLKRTSGSAGKK
eukprot:Colp12_sorted_trinity150504_noHs@16624